MIDGLDALNTEDDEAGGGLPSGFTLGFGGFGLGFVVFGAGAKRLATDFGGGGLDTKGLGAPAFGTDGETLDAVSDLGTAFFFGLTRVGSSSASTSSRKSEIGRAHV